MGSNSKGQLCLGDSVDQVMIPERIPAVGRIVDVAIGGEHTLLLDEFGNVYGCGSNSVGQLGLGMTSKKTSVPTMIDGLPFATSISAGHSHSLFTAEDGIYFTGSNQFGQLCADTDGQDLFSPTSIEDIDIENVISFEAIKSSSFVLYADGSVNSCGKNKDGQLGDGTNLNQLLAEVELDGHIVRLVGVGPSAESVFFVTQDGDSERVWGTGLNDRGQLGTGDQENTNIPTAVKFQEQVVLEVLSASGDHTVALGFVSGTFPPTESDATYPPTASPTTNTPTISPTEEVTSPSPTVTSPSPTYTPTTSMPTREGQDLFLWGAPEAVGQEDTDDVLTPLWVDEDAVSATAGSRYSMIVLSDGTALSAGYVDSLNDYQGHLGLLSQEVVQGVNEFTVISQVYDTETDTLALFAPLFDRAFAGVENTPDSGIIHSVLLDRQGQAWAMGSNNNGQLCLGDNEDRMIPQKILTAGRIVDVAIGGEHTLLLDDSGNVYGCGSNAVGQLGLGEGLIDSPTPTLLDGLNSVSSISAGHSHSIFTADDGIYFTGSNEFGQLCTDAGGNNIYTPSTLNVDERVATSAEAIKESTFILYEDGSVNGCGRNNFGQLGDGTTDDQAIMTVEVNDRVVRLLGSGPSAQSMFFVTDEELVWGTGLNNRGQVGVGDKENRDLPTRVKFGTGVLLESISAGQDHTLALGVITGTAPPTESGTTYMPTISPNVEPSPTQSPTFFVDPPTQSPTYSSTVSNKPTNLLPTTYNPTYNPTTFGATELYYWGAPESSGESSPEDITIPLAADKLVTDVSSGSHYSIVVLPDGTAESAGSVDSLDNYHGHLGVRGGDISVGDNPFQTITSVFDAENDLVLDAPFFEKAFAGAEDMSSPGSIHSLLIDQDGQAWVTGSNSKGQLCVGDFDDRLIPQKVPIDGSIVHAAIGSEHTLLLLDDGSVYGCGSNEAGQLGLGDNVQEANIPTFIDGLGTIESLSAGLEFSLFKADDALYVTGRNLFGQLCDEGTVGTDVTTPLGITGLDVASVSTFEAVKSSSFILFKDGSVGACGRNNFGQLGDGTNDDRVRTVIEPLPNDVPIRVLGVGPSSESVFFVDGDGVTHATGLNDRGQLGVGDSVNRNRLTVVDFGFNQNPAQKISASGDHTLSR
ncbi:hypothetical protein ACHAXR_012514 [Thalassiosira sp. AJA248-18]